MRKIFIDRPVTPDFSSGVFAYDYMPSIERDMAVDGYGFHHSTGRTVILEENLPRKTHRVQGWDFGNGNILCRERKVIECCSLHCTLKDMFYAAFTYPYLCDTREAYSVYLYSIPLTEENKVLMADPKVNIFDMMEPQEIYAEGMNGGISLRETEDGIMLEWLNRQKNDDTTLTQYSYDISSRRVSKGEKIGQQMPGKSIESIIRENPDPKIRYHRTDSPEGMYVCVMEPYGCPQSPAPAVVVCPGGPNIPIPRFEAEGSVYDIFRKKGFYVIVPLRRGVMGISKEWAAAINGKAGTADVEDIIKGTEFALGLYGDRIDSARTGLYGASYGGYTCLMTAGRKEGQDLFKAFVSHCGMSDLERYPYECYAPAEDVMEYYTGKEDFPAKAKVISPYNYIEGWTRPVLLVHTTEDTSVWFGQSVRTYNKALLCGKEAGLILAPGPHSYDIGNGKELLEIIACFLLDRLR